MKWPLVPRWMREPDDEYVSRTRCYMSFWSRSRFLMILFNVCILATVIWLLPNTMLTMLALQEPQNAPLVTGSIIRGTTIGIFMGIAIQTAFNGLIMGLSGFRTERLLLKYYDAHKSQCPGDDEYEDTRSQF
ncbi:MAG: hypothetical protein K0U86_17735 [Planctomycetes bacterium]|nr:hypothetical protein [Planctomycetota bacterium]MCH9726748.1 hypothetical protein [Planctomycetota bacterium]MCH9776773.1 hypothetical protein [Planctomycetota bacterium]MCH9789399.1 hypothetical protein [Planctomycetota bacterium]MDF1743043.1 hypothetical protein [Gimesia sp.]